MESPVVLDKPAEYSGKSAFNERGFPFEEEEGSSAWSSLAARHPDIAARLRPRPSAWANKRRPAGDDSADAEFEGDFGEQFDRFPFEDIPPEFREHLPSHWNRRFGSRDEPQQHQPQPQPQPQPQSQQKPQPPPSQQQHTASTQTEEPSTSTVDNSNQGSLPQYGLRNTVDLGQKSPADPSLVDAEERGQRSLSAPPDSSNPNQNGTNKMSGPLPQPEHPHEQHSQSNVRHIPIFVEGRDEPVINKSDHGAHHTESKPSYAPPPVDREQYFADDGPVSFHHPPNFSRAFGGPFNKGFRTTSQPFTQQKAYPQAAFARGNSPLRSQSPKPQQHEDPHFVKVPLHHEQPGKTEHTPSRAQQPPPQHQQAPPQHPPPPQHPQPPPPQQPASEESKPEPQPSNDPINIILNIQRDVLNLMTDVENFLGTKADKKYMYLDEMLTRNLIKLDNIETDGKENIRQARREAIKCIQKCIAVLEAKAEGNRMSQDAEMQDKTKAKNATENGESELNEKTKEDNSQETEMDESVTQATNVTEGNSAKVEASAPESKPNTKKGTKVVKKRDKSKESKDGAKVKDECANGDAEKKEKMQIDEKGDKPVENSQTMEVDGASSTSQ